VSGIRRARSGYRSAQAYFQMATFDPRTPGGRRSISSRAKVELDDRPQ
jgi:hypothetical protein